MPRHQQVTACRKGGPVSKGCNCEHCSLAVCAVCGGGEGTLTTDCPGTKVDHDRQQEVYETNLDYTDDRGWHLASERRSPRFAVTRIQPEPPPSADPRTLLAPGVDWARVDRTLDLQHDLILKGIAWVLADRVAENQSAICTRLEDEIAGRDPDRQVQELQKKLKDATADFRITNQRAEKCDDEFRQAMRQLVATLEQGSVVR